MNEVLFYDAATGLQHIPDESVDCCVTSPPYYGLRDYGAEGQIGLEKTPEEYIGRLIEVFREVKRVLKPEGTAWVNLGDSYAGSGKGAAQYPENAKKYKQGTSRGMLGAESTTKLPKHFDNIKAKDLIGIPWMFAFAMRDDGWWLRQDIIWAKPNPMPESVKDRCTRSHEYIFMFSKSRKYYYDAEAVSEPTAESTNERLKQDVENQARSDRVQGKTNGPMKACAPRYGGNKYKDLPNHSKSARLYEPTGKRNKRDVWTVTTKPFKGAHFAVYPPDLIESCILAGCPEGGTVLDPFCGSGTTLMVAEKFGRNGIGIEINENYKDIIYSRISQVGIVL